MPLIDWVQLVLFVGLLALITKPLGLYLSEVLDAKGKTFLDRILKPLERFTYRLIGVDPAQEQDWKRYTVSMLVFSFAGILFTYIILRVQAWLPLNPQGLPNLSPHLAFNTAVSFATNTNWQSYIPEATMSYFSQAVALVIHNFVSAAMGIALAAALVRGIARHTAKTIGNFWTDLVRVTYYLLLPLALVYAIFLISQGTIQNFSAYTTAHVVQSVGGVATQTIAQGPLASQEAIKMLGTNGGGFMNANSAHPFENPTPLTNFVEMLSILAIGSALTYYLGRTVGNQKHGWAVWFAMLLIMLAGFFIAFHEEKAGNPIHQQLGVSKTDGNMEGKEVRFGIFDSALFATVTTDASEGAVDSMHDSFTPLGGLVPMVNMQLDEIVFGGVGSGLYTMIVYIILTVFLVGLMIGRTPEYLGKKIEAYDVKVATLSVIVLVIFILGFTAWAAVSAWGVAGLNNSGPHGLSEMLYAYTSGAENNGSAFAGLTANTPWYNTTLGLDMLFGRFFMIIPIMALAGSLARKKRVPMGPGSFPVTGILFTVLLVAVIILITALTFFPALALGPIVEHFLMHAGTLF
ncbi:MAG TPA: potassium-transporting ATPase subunit KdpA [Candidatus Paceibacterota bacterium]|nr:potassium-transporting ATPase subunit KdpA [Candidatus Paceibacterota bacterium]